MEKNRGGEQDGIQSMDPVSYTHLAQPGLGLPSEKFDDLIGNAVVRMPDPLPYNDVYGGGNDAFCRRLGIRGYFKRDRS